MIQTLDQTIELLKTASDIDLHLLCINGRIAQAFMEQQTKVTYSSAWDKPFGRLKEQLLAKLKEAGYRVRYQEAQGWPSEQSEALVITVPK
jgi:hypothetical protein